MAGLAWEGQTAICIASGPSLLPEDCETARQMNCPTVVVNTSFQIALWADAVYAMDLRWWQHHHEEVKARFSGERLGWSKLIVKYGAEPMQHKAGFRGFGNSGADAVSVAIHRGAKRVILLGYDAQPTGGKTHWHGDHPKELSNAKSIALWPERFQMLRKYADKCGVQVLNASRATALRCFERITL